VVARRASASAKASGVKMPRSLAITSTCTPELNAAP
jgi:hypothetical protein